MAETDEQERQRAENRRRYPAVARFVDEVRKHWPGAVVTDVRKMSPEEYRQRYLEKKRCQAEFRK
jgi:hypothetical protein